MCLSRALSCEGESVFCLLFFFLFFFFRYLIFRVDFHIRAHPAAPERARHLPGPVPFRGVLKVFQPFALGEENFLCGTLSSTSFPQELSPTRRVPASETTATFGVPSELYAPVPLGCPAGDPARCRVQSKAAAPVRPVRTRLIFNNGVGNYSKCWLRIHAPTGRYEPQCPLSARHAQESRASPRTDDTDRRLPWRERVGQQGR